MKRSMHGFTLIEVLVAVGLLAVGVALAFASLHSLTQASTRAEITSQRAERLRAVQGFMRGQLSTALPIAFRIDADQSRTVVFSGKKDEIRFVAGMPGYLARGGAYLQVLRLDSGPQGQQLLYEFQQLGPDGPLPEERPAQVLLDGIREAQFEYRTLGPNGRPGPWQAQWNQGDALPPLIRLRLRFDDERKSWPDFVVAVRLGAASAVGSGQDGEPLAEGKRP